MRLNSGGGLFAGIWCPFAEWSPDAVKPVQPAATKDTGRYTSLHCRAVAYWSIPPVLIQWRKMKPQTGSSKKRVLSGTIKRIRLEPGFLALNLLSWQTRREGRRCFKPGKCRKAACYLEQLVRDITQESVLLFPERWCQNFISNHILYPGPASPGSGRSIPVGLFSGIPPWIGASRSFTSARRSEHHRRGWF